jgi:aryl-alcohol dehydrogenase-like predicted oxidoreductase
VLTLRVDEDTPAAVRTDLIAAALDAGINSFDLGGLDPSMLEEVGPALAVVDRSLLYVSVRFGVALDRGGQIVRDFSPERLVRAMDETTSRSRLGHLDLALLDDPAAPELPLRTLQALKAARDEGRVRRLGVCGAGPAMDAYINTGAFDMLVTPYSLTSGWQDRHRLKAATAEEMSVFGYGYYPHEIRKRGTAARVGGLLSRLFGRTASADDLPSHAGYAFLDAVSGWTPEEICLAFALTEPGLSSVVVAPDSVEALKALATVPERELPPNLPAQIEMARFAHVKGAA